MKFTWDEAKRRFNLIKHKLDFVDASAVFDGITATFEDNRFDYGEQRFITLGLLSSAVVVIVHTERDNSIRVISMRKATKYEQKLYFQSFTD